MEKLLLLIGKGQKELAREGLKIERMTYRETEYFLSDNTEESFKTPFVGEAIVRLYPQRFEQVHIFGTKDAMWDILYYHCRAEVNKDLPDEYIEPFLQLCEAIEQHNWQEPDCLLDYVAQSFSAKTGIRCFCHLIDLGITPEELWKTFQLMTSPHLKLDGHKISIDITHSLRFHPLFFVFTLNYLQSVSPKTRFGSIFYGAFELSANFNKKTPIFDLKTFIDIMKWIDAAQAFRQYGDASAIAKLLEENGTLQPLIDDLKKFSQIIQLTLRSAYILIDRVLLSHYPRK